MVHEAQGQLVQEVATGGLPAPPSRYVLREKDRPTGGGEAPELGFPTVDVQRLAQPGDVEEAAKLQAALQSWGLFAVTGHGIPESLLDDIHEAGREFFHLPPSSKLQYANQTDAGEFQNEGYGIDRVDTDEQILDWCDRLYLTVQPEESRQLRLWPRHPPSLAKLLHEYALRSEEVAKQVLRAMARALGFDEDFFLGRHHHAPPGPRRRRAPGVKGREVGGRTRAPPRRAAGCRRRRDGDHEQRGVPGADAPRGGGPGEGEDVAGDILPAGAAPGPGARRGARQRGPAGDVQEGRRQDLRRRVLGRVRAWRAHHRLPRRQGRQGGARARSQRKPRVNTPSRHTE
ncbi:unnamed protein product [Urochloa humidicola]